MLLPSGDVISHSRKEVRAPNCKVTFSSSPCVESNRKHNIFSRLSGSMTSCDWGLIWRLAEELS